MRRCAVLNLMRLRKAVLIDRIVSAAALSLLSVLNLFIARASSPILMRGYMESGLPDGGRFPLDGPCSGCLRVAAEVSD
jgi:hypothetical protein